MSKFIGTIHDKENRKWFDFYFDLGNYKDGLSPHSFVTIRTSSYSKIDTNQQKGEVEYE